MNPIYQFTIPLFVKHLTALDAILTKVETVAKEKGLDEAAILAKALAPDMFPLKKQVQVACDQAKGAAARLSGTTIPVHEDNEVTIADLHARIKKVQDYLATITEDMFAGADTRQVTLPYFPGKYLTGFDYAREHGIPNFFFHVTTAYDILRMTAAYDMLKDTGFELGKADFVGGLPLRELEAMTV